jgi:hypothetical protein
VKNHVEDAEGAKDAEKRTAKLQRAAQCSARLLAEPSVTMKEREGFSRAKQHDL